MTYQPVQDYPERHGVKGWHIAAAAAAVCLIGGSFLTTEVCKPAPTVSSTAPSKGILDQINDALPTAFPTVPEAPPLPWDEPTTTAPRTTTTTTTTTVAKYDVGFAPSYSFAEPDAHKKCGVDTGRMQNLSATQARCLINSGQYVAKGESPPGAVQPGVQTNGKGQVCTAQKPVWYWLGFPLGLLAIFLAWTSFSASRRDDAAHFDNGGFAGTPDLPPPPPPPSFGGAPAGVQQPATPTAPRSAPTHHYDDFGDEDY
ncbi:MAG: hypothetical protein KDB26_05620 [Microthrixaceae bacterium]|nr:hypothetical protein [Microthrixaceae bacterium]